MKEPGYASEIDAINDLCRRGYTANFQIRDNTLSEVTSGRMFRPGELAIVEHHRFEGASDPDDMSVVYAIESDDGVHGIVVDAFGTYADPAFAAFLKGIKKREHV